MDLKEGFEQAGFEAIACQDIAAARRALEQVAPALLLVDVSLPDGDGIDLVDELRATPASLTLPIILMSGEEAAAEAFKSLATGADEFIAKPYDLAQVIDTARRLIERGAAAEAAGARPRIVVIDDSLSFREALREALEAAGYVVAAADNGASGLRLAAEVRPQVLLVDSNMPGEIGGTGVLRRMHYDAALEHIPCLLVTGSPPDQTEREVLELGAYSYVRKEEGIEAVVARVRSILRHSSGTALEALPSLFSPKKFLAIGTDQRRWDNVAALLHQHQLIRVEEAQQARALLERQPFDCILLQPQPLERAGIGLCRQLKAWPTSHDVPLILIVHQDERHYGIAGVNAGADDYVTADRDSEVLAARIFAQLRRRQLERRIRQFAEERWHAQSAAAEAEAARELAQTRAALLAELERKNLELLETNRELERVRRQREHAMAFLVHDLKNPLALIMGHAQLVARRPELGKFRESFHQIYDSAQSMNRMLMNLLDISRSDDGALRPDFAPQELAPIVENVRATMEVLIQERGPRIEFTARGPALVMGDGELLRRLVENLFDNAIKYSPNTGTIAVELRPLPELAQVELRVADEGPGVPEADREKIFERYFRIERESAQRSSRGLGLSFCKIAAELHHGSIRVESREPNGSVFCVTLPVAAGKPKVEGSDLA